MNSLHAIPGELNIVDHGHIITALSLDEIEDYERDTQDAPQADPALEPIGVNDHDRTSLNRKHQ